MPGCVRAWGLSFLGCLSASPTILCLPSYHVSFKYRAEYSSCIITLLRVCVPLCGIDINCKVSAFVDVEDPVRMLTDTHVLEFGPECEVYKDHRVTTDEIKHLCSGTNKPRNWL